MSLKCEESNNLNYRFQESNVFRIEAPFIIGKFIVFKELLILIRNKNNLI
jgi:hypothetical protein